MYKNFPFSQDITVRWSEVDSMKMVFNAHYLTYLDIASAEYLKSCLQEDLIELSEQGKFDFVLVKSTMEFKSPARLWEKLRVYCRTKEMGNTSFTKEFIITKEDDTEVVLTADIIYASFDTKENKAVPIPEFIREQINVFEETGKI